MNHIAMILSNGFAPDLRVDREMNYLIQHHFQVSLIAWDRKREFQSYEELNGISIYRIHSVFSDYAVGWKQLFQIGKFWRHARRRLLDLKPDCIHCHDLDTLYVGYRIKKKLGCKLVFDAHEHYPSQMTLYLPKFFYYALSGWQSWLMRSIDAIITASTILGDEIRQKVDKPVVTVGNYQLLETFEQVGAYDIRRIKKTLGPDKDHLNVAYIGGFTRNRALEPFIKAAELLPQVQFHLWGDGPQRNDIEKWQQRYHNVHYHGWLCTDKIPLYFKSMDVIYYALKPDYPGAKYNAPNTLTQAMAAARPVIANEIGDLGRIIKETGCGLLLDSLTPNGIANMLTRLLDKKLRENLGRRGLEAARMYYNADNAGKVLVDLYGSMF
jgi:glycosyltransferase involved in cell wall biosynthesis